ncbi:Serine/threonine-protein kinase STK11 [Gracilariopsis chorda]|uniref:Serine/threonine-protein kinase STK11 n=1 Tax=Gracilariopsis chorda TaxID=448386 RepID=A0A2V3INS2_9FLOR|nr:Serine/threonine-protein kinase STK11 [Gracilariopsis chorda]|eukprot:PXF43722.1 Serine/threonine-protein kinase STK11 [Gracilariopsis chorda]
MSSFWSRSSDDPADFLFPRRSAPTSPTGPPAAQSSFPFSFDSSSSDDDFPSGPRRPKFIQSSKTSFLLGEKLGEGAFAVVREGIDQNTLRLVAIKVLDMRRIKKMRGGAAAVVREVRVQKRLKRHPNLIELIDVIRPKHSSKTYIVLELSNGCTVAQLADRNNGTLPHTQVANYAYQVLRGLHYMHGKGVVHRDIKPANMMLNVNGTLKISDFGVAEFLDEYNQNDNVSRTSGSPAFQAPEIARGDADYSGMKVDVWALGISIFLLITGRIPFQGDNLVQLFENIGRGTFEMPPELPHDIQHVLSQMLTVDWRQRASVGQLLRHPWIVRGSLIHSDSQMEQLGWIKIPAVRANILDAVRRLYVDDADMVQTSALTEDAHPQDAASDAASAPQREEPLSMARAFSTISCCIC